ncbi:hypothetical protein TB1_010607 [Malus domestica]
MSRDWKCREMRNIRNMLQLLHGVLSRLSDQLARELVQDEDGDLEDQALAAARNHDAVCGNHVAVFHGCENREERGGGGVENSLKKSSCPGGGGV